MIEDGVLVGGGYKPITIRIIEMARSRESQKLGAASKMNRDPAFLRRTDRAGRGPRRGVRRPRWGSSRPGGPATPTRCVAFFAEDCDDQLGTAVHGAGGAARQRPASGTSSTDALGKKIRLDLTRKQISGDRVSWRIRLPAGDDGSARKGLAQAQFSAGRITSFRLGPIT